MLLDEQISKCAQFYYCIAHKLMKETDMVLGTSEQWQETDG